jgi:Outer membrane protein/protective antigen OMA87
MRLKKFTKNQWFAAVIFVLLGIAPTQAAIVSSIDVVGNERVDASTVTAYFPVMVGDNIDDVILNEAVKRLFDTGLFQDVRITEEKGRVRIQVAENPIVSRIY